MKFQSFTLLDAEQSRDWLDRTLRALEGGTAPASSNQGVQMTDQFGASVVQLLRQHAPLVEFAQPNRFSMPVANRMTVETWFGRHVDVSQVLDVQGRMMIADLAYSLILSDFNDYRGGEFELVEGASILRIRPSAGTLVVYRGASYHGVLPITAGVRVSITGWIESLVRPE